MSLFNTTENAFGLDIFEGGLRLVQLVKKRKQITVECYNEIRLPEGCINDGRIIKPDVFLDSMQKLVKTKIGRGKLSDEIVAVLPERQTFLKTLEIESSATTDENIVAEIKTALPEHMPVDIESIYFDWQIIKQEAGRKTVLVGVSPKEIADSYFNLLNQLGFLPVVLEIESAAISRALSGQFNGNCPQIVIDIGASRTGLFVQENGIVKFAVSLPISGLAMTKTIMDNLSMSREEAEKAKAVCGLDRVKCHGALLEIFTETIDNLIKHIREAAEYHQNNFGCDQKISRVILCGGGANLINITGVLQEKLGLETVISDPWLNLPNPDPGFFTAQKSQSFITAIGLALRGIDSNSLL